MSTKPLQMPKDQLRRIVRTIVMHDNVPHSARRKRPVEASKHVLDTLYLNFSTADFDRREAEQIIFDEIMDH